jgi:uncharacterized SAM-binding protein YcdF (DUF218 family)
MHEVKNFAHFLATPFAMASCLAMAGVVLLVFRMRRAGRAALVLALVVGYLGCTSLVYVVVLGSGYDPADHLPVTAALDRDGLVRVVEGIRISRRLHDARLVVSGGAGPGDTPSAYGYQKLADELGVDVPRANVLDTPRDTEEESRAVAARIGAAPFILVTSAYHMPRAMRLMHQAGLDPIAAPTGQRVGVPPITGVMRLLPTSSGLRKTELALHEYAGLLAMGAGLP